MKVGRILADLSWCSLLADADGAAQGPSPLTFLPPFIIIGLLYYFMMIKPQRARDAGHKTLLSNLKKNDRVVTIGGIYGVVVNVQRDQDEVTIKVDEGNNTKLRLTFNAIARVITDDSAGDNTTKE
jgi:preprotein translocase subunit YajC